jgi:hypothetical protein
MLKNILITSNNRIIQQQKNSNKKATKKIINCHLIKEALLQKED